MESESETKRTRVIAVGNQKGGVGKSTVSTHLAAALGEMGRKCLIWDLDSNSGTTRCFNIPETFLGAFEVMIGDEEPEDIIITNDPTEKIVLPKNVDLIIARRNLDSLDEILRSRNRFADGRDSLRAPLEKLRGKYDYIFLDTAPNTNPPTMAAYKAAEWFIVSAIPDPLAIKGINDAMADIQAVRENGNPRLELLGVVLSCVDRRTRLAIQLSSFVHEAFPQHGGSFHVQLSRSVAIPEAQKLGKTVLEADPTHKMAEQYRELAREVEARLELREKLSLQSSEQELQCQLERVANA
jgi:chromosome partitioning protein